MPTKIEQRYVDQGYVLPEGVTWDMVHDVRTQWSIPDMMVPVARAAFGSAWGVPYKDGRPLQWREQ